MLQLLPQALLASALFSFAATEATAQSVPAAESAEQTTIYQANFVEEDGGFTTDTPMIWKKNDTRGWQAFGRIGTTNMAIDAYLTSEEIDLTGYTDASLSLTQIASLAKNDDPSMVLHVEILEGDKVTEINDRLNWPDGSNYDPVSSSNVRLSEWAGKKIRVQFHYTSTTVEALIWAISSLTIQGTPSATGIAQATANQAFDATKPYAIYSVNGTKLASLSAPGVKIVRQNGRTWKLMR